MIYPFEVNYDYLKNNLEEMVNRTISGLQSQFLLVPKGENFIEYADFQDAYEVLKRHTLSFLNFNEQTIWDAILEDSLSLVVLRAILGISPPEWAELANEEYQVKIDGRSIDSNCREINKKTKTRDYIARNPNKDTRNKIRALVSTAVKYIQQGDPNTAKEDIHRLAKVDTAVGLVSLQYVAAQDVPYAMLLYERFLGRPFATHRDAVSGLLGNVMETAVENLFKSNGITSYRRTNGAQRLSSLDQTPDFVIPDEYHIIAVIEAKISNDGGTARDKVARIRHLRQLSDQRISQGEVGFEVIACIDGRGFGERPQLIREILEATRGKVFTFSTLDQLITNTQIRNYLPADKSNV